MLESNPYFLHSMRWKKQTVCELCTFIFRIKACMYALLLFKNGTCLLTEVICCVRLALENSSLWFLDTATRHSLIPFQNCKGLTALNFSCLSPAGGVCLLVGLPARLKGACLWGMGEFLTTSSLYVCFYSEKYLR